ncbi:MAG: VanZ family protein [Clostridiales bacterium]|nr:VanZ family protein [Clostridiales bacterium]
MEKNHLARKIIAGIFYSGGILFALFIGFIIFKGNSIFSASDLIFSAICVCMPIVIAAFILIPTMSGIDERLKTARISILIMFAFYIIILANALFYNGMRHFAAVDAIGAARYFKWSINLIPFKTIGKYIRAFISDSINKSIIIENLLGNILIFAPMGVLLPCIFQSLHKFKKFLITMLTILISVEIVQLFTRSGICDIDDVILNLLGAVLFYGLWSTRSVQKVLMKIYVLKNA